MQRLGAVASPGFCNKGEVRYGSIGGLEYEVPLQSRLYCLCINVALCSTTLQCICRVIRRSSVTMKAHTYYIIFGRPPIRGEAFPLPLAAPLTRRTVNGDEECVQEGVWTSRETEKHLAGMDSPAHAPARL